MKNFNTIIFQFLLLVTLLMSYSALLAQSIPDNFFGINYWLLQKNHDGSYNDGFLPKVSDLEDAQIRFVRIGGNYANTNSNADLNFFLYAIGNVQSMSPAATPLVQIPINMDEYTLRDEWLPAFDNAGVTHFAIGNEPDPGGDNNWKSWFNNGNPSGAQHDGNDYHSFESNFIKLAKRIRNHNKDFIIVGPSFRLFWGNEWGDTPLSRGKYYERFIKEVGKITWGGGYPILDVLSYNYYGFKDESEMKARHTVLQKYIQEVNDDRANFMDPSKYKSLSIAMTEANTNDNNNDPHPNTFKAGQMLILNAKMNMKYGAKFICPWSVRESGRGFSLYVDDATDIRKPTMHHWALLATNSRGNFMNSRKNDSYYENKVVHFGMTDSNGTTIVIMNTTDTDYTYNAKLSASQYSSFPYNGNPVQVKLGFDSSVGTEWSGALPKFTTLVYTINENGRRLVKYEYRDTYQEPNKIILYNGGTDFASDNEHDNLKIIGEKGVIVFPNPVEDLITIEGVEGFYIIELYDNAGQLVKEADVSGLSTINFDVSELTPDVYFLNLIGEEGAIKKRFLKK